MSDEVAKALEEYEAEQLALANSAEASEIRALAQGIIVGSILRLKNEGTLLKMSDVELAQDENGDYEHHFTIVTESGIRICVTTEIE